MKILNFEEGTPICLKDVAELMDLHHAGDPAVTREVVQQAFVTSLRQGREKGSRLAAALEREEMTQAAMKTYGIDPVTLEIRQT